MAEFLNDPFANLNEVPRFEVTSTDITDGAELDSPQQSGKMGVPGGGDVSPQLSWSGAPEGTKSYAVTVFDPEAPTGSGFWHWVVSDIPGDVTELPSDAGNADSPKIPSGAVVLNNDAGFAGFVGAAPPPGHGPHRYFFIVHAMDTDKLGVQQGASPAYLNFNIFSHCIGRAWLTCTFEMAE